MTIPSNMTIPTKQCRKCLKTFDITNFSKHSGTRDKLDNRCKGCVKECKNKCKDNINDIKEYDIYDIDMTCKDWQVGKPTGTILERKDAKYGTMRYEVRITLPTKKVSKCFSHKMYKTKDEAYNSAFKWLYETSTANGLTRNMIKINDNYAEVQLTQGYVMKIDIDDIDICQKYTLLSTKSSSATAKYYASLSIGNKLSYFHNYITGNTMSDHINRDPMDNRKQNLSQTTSKLNNNNRGTLEKYKKYAFHEVGIRYIHRDEAWQARIKQDNKEYTQTFAIKKYGYEKAKHMAIDARKKMNIQFNCTNSLYYDVSNSNKKYYQLGKLPIEIKNDFTLDMIMNSSFHKMSINERLYQSQKFIIIKH